MEHCIIIQAHKNLDQLKVVFDLLSYADIYIHIDKKNEKLQNDLEEYLYSKKIKNIYLLDNRVNVSWSGFSQVRATLNLIESVINSKKNYDYVHFISGQDLPIKSFYQIEKIIKSYKSDLIKDPAFIECLEINNHEWRLKLFSFFRENKFNRTLLFRILDNFIRRIQMVLHISRKNLNNLNLYMGSTWWSLPFECIKFIDKYVKENPEILKDFRFTSCPDEHFFQILIMNSQYKSSVINDNLRFVEFEAGKSSPKIITNCEIERIMKSNKIFARKFDIDIDSDAIYEIHKRMY